MASQQDLQELLRLLTIGKVPIKDAMMRVKALQSKNLRSIKQIADASLSDIQDAISDAKAAKSLHNACKARIKNPNPSAGSKRAGAELLQSASKKSKADDLGYLEGPAPVEPAELEASLALRVETDEDKMANTVLTTNRAPLVLAFAVELLRYTMPEQPPSSRLSLGQAVVSANSRSKAVSIGLEKGLSADEEGWGHGQPRVKVMGREVTVLKRGGYEWTGDERFPEAAGGDATQQGTETAGTATSSVTISDGASQPPKEAVAESHVSKAWAVSSPVSLKKSTFIVRAVSMTGSSQREGLLNALHTDIPSLSTANHNAWAYRVHKPDMFGSHTIKEDSFDDGETGCGDFLIKIMRELNAFDTLVVMTRWWGGIMLGPDRWRIMRNCLKEALAERLRVTGEQSSLGGQALWGLDLEAMKKNSMQVGSTAGSAARSYEAGVVGMPVHRPEAARAYLLKSFATCAVDEGEPQQKTAPKKKTASVLNAEKEQNLAELLGSLRLLFDSWAEHLPSSELDRRAWSWYTAVRPEVDSGPSGWGAKGNLKLADILALRRRDP